MQDTEYRRVVRGFRLVLILLIILAMAVNEDLLKHRWAGWLVIMVGALLLGFVTATLTGMMRMSRAARIGIDPVTFLKDVVGLNRRHRQHADTPGQRQRDQPSRRSRGERLGKARKRPRDTAQ